jgi:hypothetical protein
VLSGAETHDGLTFSARGLALSPVPGGSPGMPRAGRIVSRPLRLDFAANAVSPLWQAELPERATLVVELSMSSDGQRWEPWHEMAADPDAATEIEETYPDGRPNPNHGFTPGGMLLAEEARWTHLRYRVTLSCAVPASPVLSALRFFYQDTTLGRAAISEPRAP